MRDTDYGAAQDAVVARHEDVAIRILPRDFPRRVALLLLCLLLVGVSGTVRRAQAGGSISARATVVSPDALRAVDELLRERPAPGANLSDPGGFAAPAGREIIRGGAWIRVFEGSVGNSAAERQLQVVYLGN